MRKVLWTALACLAAAVLALLAVRLGVQAAVPAYPASLGGDPIPEKITGETLIRAAAAQDAPSGETATAEANEAAEAATEE